MATEIPADESLPSPMPPSSASSDLSRVDGDFDCSGKSILIRSVWSGNLEYEISLIRDLIDRYPFVSMDTEFPGVVFRHHNRYSDPLELYQTLKLNVDALKLLQVGITLADESGNLPNCGFEGRRYIWEFNLCDFDLSFDAHSPTSIDLLRHQGFDFESTRKYGVTVSRFAEVMMSSGLVCNNDVTYITFHSGYDFGYLIKAITGKTLPDTLPEFLTLLKIFFGNQIYDVKHLMKFCRGLFGGLNRVAESLGVNRAVGKCHQAGSDSLLTWNAFEKIRDVYFGDAEGKGRLNQFAGVLYGLEIPHS